MNRNMLYNCKRYPLCQAALQHEGNSEDVQSLAESCILHTSTPPHLDGLDQPGVKDIECSG